jgi:hypothetical protein
MSILACAPRVRRYLRSAGVAWPPRRCRPCCGRQPERDVESSPPWHSVSTTGPGYVWACRFDSGDVETRRCFGPNTTAQATPEPCRSSPPVYMKRISPAWFRHPPAIPPVDPEPECWPPKVLRQDGTEVTGALAQHQRHVTTREQPLRVHSAPRKALPAGTRTYVGAIRSVRWNARSAPDSGDPASRALASEPVPADPTSTLPA